MEVKLKDIAKIESSGVDKKSFDGEKEVYLCNFVDVYHNWAITKSMLSKFMKATANSNEIAKFQLYKGQVAITKDSETRDDIGMSTYIADDLENTLLGYHCTLITPNSLYLVGKYLNAYLNTLTVRKYFSNQSSGSGQRYTLTTDAIGNLNMVLPDVSVQKRIGDLFSYIDKKIEINKMINNNLPYQLLMVA